MREGAFPVPSLRYRLGRLIFPRRASLVRLLPRLIFLGVLGLLTYLSMNGIVRGFSLAMRRVAESRQIEAARRPGDEAGDLFRKLVHRDQLKFVQGDLKLGIDCAAVRDGAVHDLDETSRSLCLSDVGHAVRAEVDAWNRGRQVLAVRDNRSLGQPCAKADKAADSGKAASTDKAATSDKAASTERTPDIIPG
jgi:hypothetical protein